MNRLLLEIYPEKGDRAATLPPIVIAAGNEPPPASPGGPTPIVLRLNGGNYALQRSTDGTDVPLSIGQWHEAGGWKLRITNALAADASMTVTDNPSWAAPEIRITSRAADGLEKQTRCVLPTEDGSELIVGRSPQHANLVIEDDHISRKHLRFFTRDGRRYAEDLGSKWGTRLNAKPLTDPVELKHGDEIILGNSTIQYTCYWDILPEAGASQSGGVSDELSVRPTELSPPEEPPAPQSKPAPDLAAPESTGTPLPSKQTKEQEPEAPPPPDPKEPEPPPEPPKPSGVDEEGLASWDDGSEPPKKPKKPKRKGKSWIRYFGFDIGGAIFLVLLLLAGMAYLAWKVFHQ